MSPHLLLFAVAACRDASTNVAAPPTRADSRSSEGNPKPVLRHTPVPTESGFECGAAADCHPQAAGHASWCGPLKLDFTHASVDAVSVPGTLDGHGLRLPHGVVPGCRCVNGHCEALLNDGRRVIGPHAEA